jgi:ubiquinone/menaquinone biosynthesis C-methylase UbiE
MVSSDYLMESDEEAHRLALKTDVTVTTAQAVWAGIKPGMRVADIGCGSGKTTQILNQIVQPGGKTVGIDASEARLTYAREQFNHETIQYICRDIHDPFTDIGTFDFIWVRFVLEYFRSSSFDIVKKIAGLLNPGGILCLIDLDYNCLNHFGLSDRLKRTLQGLIKQLEEKADFDPYAGIKLYSFLYDLGFEDIDVHLSTHHLIYGELNEVDAFNWLQKVKVAGRGSGYDFTEYTGGYEEFFNEFRDFFYSPRRFTYTPIISCRGTRPVA